MTDQILIRPAVAADACALSVLICDVLWASNLADYGPENVARVASHFTADGVQAMLTGSAATWVAVKGDNVVGTASISGTDDKTVGALKTFFVDAGMQRAGIGTALLRTLEAWGRDQGWHNFTVRSSIAGEPFYSRCGFVPVRDHWDGDERTIEMKKS